MTEKYPNKDYQTKYRNRRKVALQLIGKFFSFFEGCEDVIPQEKQDKFMEDLTEDENDLIDFVLNKEG